MGEDLKRHKEQEQAANDRRIEEEIEAVFNDPKKGAFASSIAAALGLHRNTVSERAWHLSRPLNLGERFFVANELVSVKDLLNVIKEHRLKKKERRSKGQIRQAETLTDELEGLEKLLENLRDENAKLFLEVAELEDVIRNKEKAMELDKKCYSMELKKNWALREENSKLKKSFQELEAEFKDLKSRRGRKVAMTVLKPPKSND